MKKISKKTIATVLAGTTVAATGVLLGVGLTTWTDNSDDYIIFHYGNEELVLDSKDITQLEVAADKVIETKELSIYEEPPAEDPEGEEPPAEDPEGEEPPAEEEPNDGDDTNKEIAANWIETGFYYIALTGELPSLEDGEIKEIHEGSIFGSEEYQNDFIIINTAEQFNSVYTELIEISLFRNTSGSGKYAYQYMNELAQQHPALTPYVAPFMDPQFKTVWDMKDVAYETEYNTLIDHLKYTMNIESDVTTSLYVYSYLYQEHVSSAFDYYMTEQLVDQKPMIMWEMSVSGLNAHNGDEMDALLNLSTGYLNEDAMWGETGNSLWQDKIDNDHNYNVGDVFKTDAHGLQGFLGMISGTAATVNVEGFSDYENFQEFRSNDETKIEKISSGNIGEINIAIDGTYDDEIDALNGTVIVPDEDNTTGKVVAYVPLYPFSFAHNYDKADETADYYSYSLTAYDVNHTAGEDIDWNASNVSGVYTYDETKGAEVTYFDLVGVALEENEYLNALFENNWLSSVEAFSLWLFDFVFRANMDNLTISAQQYWRSEGFYIELSGQYEDDYAQLLPLWIQK